jgi:pyruvate dehydrogenase E2 component (dihydrolipoamide acetyltransferase)
MTEFLMPKLGADMTAGTLVTWHKKPGEAVQRGDIVAEVDTDKGVIDVEIFAGGVVEKLLVQPGQRVPVGTPLALIQETTNGQQPSSTTNAPKRDTDPERDTEVGNRIPIRPAQPEASRIASDPFRSSATQNPHFVGPAARRRARELGIDPRSVVGATPGGAIMILDNGRPAGGHHEGKVTREASATPGSDDLGAAMRSAIAAAMSRSKRETPHYYLATTVDMNDILTWLAEQNARRAVTDRLLPAVLVLKAIALALRRFPALNVVWEDGRAVQKPEIHLGVAISLKHGLIAPALHNADTKSLDQLMSDFRDLVTRARTGALRSSELSDPTLTVTSLGDQGVETVFGIIYPPQTALFGVGRIVDRPWAAKGQVVVRPIMNLTLSADHRVTDGHYGALALKEIDRRLQEPHKL